MEEESSEFTVDGNLPIKVEPIEISNGMEFTDDGSRSLDEPFSEGIDMDGNRQLVKQDTLFDASTLLDQGSMAEVFLTGAEMDEEKLIELVRDHPLLYDTAQKGYSNVNLKAKVWAAIAAKSNFPSGDEAKNMWLKLRDAYRSSLKRLETKSGDDPSKTVKWKYSNQMSFLKPYMKDRKRHANETDNTPIVEIHDISNSSAPGVGHCSESVSQEPPAKCPNVPSQATKKPSNIQRVITALMRRKEVLKSRDEWRRQQFQRADELKLFFDSMYETTKKLAPVLQKQVKRKLFAIVSDAEDAMENINQDANFVGEMANSSVNTFSSRDAHLDGYQAVSASSNEYPCQLNVFSTDQQ